jgi:hypothetical protein
LLKKIIFIITVLLPGVLFSQEPEIKTLQVYAGSNETSLAVVSEDEKFNYLTIEFDIKSEFIPDFNIVFRFCDSDWRPYDNLFLRNTGQNVAYNIDVKRLSVTVEEAEYHFRGIFPNNYDNVDFPFSGKWMFYVTDSNDTSIVYATGRFYVVQREIKLTSSLKHEKLEDETFHPADMAKIFNVTTAFNLPDELHPSNISHIEIIENQKIFYPVIIDRSFNTNRRNYYWDGNRSFRFTARDIRPGNEYRRVDLRDSRLFAGKDVRAQLDGLEYPRFFKSAPRDMNGGFMISRTEVFPTYLNVTFEIRPDNDYGNIFLTGAFNNWLVLPEYEMVNRGGVYTKTINLKRGAYDYQYVVADVINDRIKNEDWYILEGNDWRTTNVYHIFLYYTDPQYGGYDRIIGYTIQLNK